MKGQANIEYMVALVIFIVLMLYISFQVASSVPYYHSNSLENRLQSDCLRISEMLVKDSESGVGFAIEPYELNGTKMDEFNDTCDNPSNYEGILKDMSLEAERDFQLVIYVNATLDFVCGRRYVPSQLSVVSIERYATTDGQPTSIMLSIW